MDRNANDVVTVLLVNPNGIDARELEGEYAKADIARYGYVPPDIHKPPGPSNETLKTWPTLGQMIDKGERLVSLIQSLAPDVENAPYLLNQLDFVWENAYEVTDPRAICVQPRSPFQGHDSQDARLRPVIPDEPLPVLAAGIRDPGS
jgi:hypothetical protein